MLPVAILAGGLATRLRPVTTSIPKALIEINGEPFLAHQLRLLASRGIGRVTMCVGYLGDMIREYAGEGGRFGIEVTYSFDGPELRGTAGAIAGALPLLGESFFVLYGDSYLPCDYAAVEHASRLSGQPALMTVFENRGQWDASNVEFSAGRIIEYAKKMHTPAMHHIDYGLGVFHADVFADVPKVGTSDLAELYRKLLSEGRLAGYEVRQRFYEIGSLEGIRELSRVLAEPEAS